ncbi:acetyl-CoA carboxylase biotin carboxyl carrier protein [Nisaea acidiphila]|uniref:Biotin carboxyl carrier protein of acetyl-CoA carboxylase n=1 Tax=Nisaea acidiphila TaxID=1862145 RepID=A0A9J7AQK7_9PROT|nr:acetyl-CoA carboxylase biotin carboxyl carrier protein [Nisaea acidiphila]UUX49170.1 acetyl-CoA carboxylase biotin carboxyl carrier protein [Nisaea acidiphila]
MSHDIDSKLVKKLAKLLDETGLGELEYATDDWRIRVARPAAAPQVAAMAPAPAPAPATAASADSVAPAAVDNANAVKSPMVGTAYLGPDPDSAPFVSVGSKVSEGQTLMIVEAMKVMNPIPAPRAGTVKEILIQNAQPVEFGEPLIVIE